jgi:hypothetical protein
VASPVFNISGRKLFVMNNEMVLCILLFCGLCEIERSGNDDFVVYDRDLVMSYGVGCIDFGRNAGVDQEVGGRVLLGPLTLVQDNLDVDFVPILSYSPTQRRASL